MAKERVPLSESLKRQLKTEVGGKCPFEGCAETVLEYHHINGDPSDNRRSNLIAICANHHARETRFHEFGATHFRELKLQIRIREVRWRRGFDGANDRWLAQVAAEELRATGKSLVGRPNAKFLQELLETIKLLVDAGQYRNALRQLRVLRRSFAQDELTAKVVDPKACNLAGVCCSRMGKPQRAIAYFEAGLAAGETWKLWTNLASSYLCADRPEDGLAAARKGVDLGSSEGAALVVLGLAHWEACGDLAAARENLSRAQELDPTSATPSLHLARILAEAQETDAAVAALNRVNLTKWTPLLLSQRAIAKQAIAVARLNRSGITTNGVYAMTRLGGGTPSPVGDPLLREASDDYEAAIAEMEPDRDWRLLARDALATNAARCLILQGRYGRALHFARLALDGSHPSDDDYVLVPFILGLAGHHRAMLRAIDASPSSARARSEMKHWRSVGLFHCGRIEDARAELAPIVAQPDATSENLHNFATILALLGRPVEEIEGVAQRLRQVGEATALDRNIGMCLARVGECSSAREYLERAAAAFPDDLELLEQLARTTFATQGLAAADRVLSGRENAMLEFGGSLAFAVVHSWRGRCDAAKRHLSRVMTDVRRKGDRPGALRIGQFVARDEPARVDFGCRIVVLP